MTITELSIKRPILVVVFFTFIGVLGIFGYSQLKYELMPSMSFPVVVVNTIYPGASPDEVESSVSKTLEDAFTGIDKVKTMSSMSFESRSMIVLEFDPSVDIDFALQDVQRKINQYSYKLPNTVEDPMLLRFSMDEMPILRLGVSADMNSKELYQYVKDKIVPSLSKLNGVGAITTYGGEQREIRVNIDAEKLKAYGLSITAVNNAVRFANMDFPTGKVYTKDNQYVVRVAGKYNSLEQMKDLVVGKSKFGNTIRLRDVAEVNDGTKDVTSIYRINGENSIGLVFQKQQDANTVETANLIKAELEKIKKNNPEKNLNFIIAQDGSIEIMDSANAVKMDLFLAVLIVAFIMLIFLHSLRDSLIVMVAIPSSLIATVFIMYILGMSLNIMTLLAMSLVIGILVDDSIVVLENIHKHLEKGENKALAALRGRNEIGFAALSITLVDVVVFLPLALINDVIGDFLREYALVVVSSTLMSLLVSFTITPMLASRFSKLEDKNSNSIFARIGRKLEGLTDGLVNIYSDVLEWSLNHGGKVVIGIVLILSSTFLLFKFGLVGVEFFPKPDNGELSIQLEANPGTTIESTNELVRQVEVKLSQIPEVSKIVTNVGTMGSGVGATNQSHTAEVLVTLVDKHDREFSTDVYGQKIKEKLSGLPLRVNVIQSTMGGGSNQSPIQILLSGTTMEEIMPAAERVKKILESTEGVIDVRFSSEESNPELTIDIDRDKLASFGLSVGEVGQTLQVALTGGDDSKFKEKGDEYEIRVMLDKFDRNNIENVRNITFTNMRGQSVYLEQFAKIEQSVGPTKLERRDRIRSIIISANVFGVSSGTAGAQIAEKLNEKELPNGVTWKYIGQQENMKSSMTSLLLAIGAGILFVYMIMVALYNSYLYPFVVLFSIPLAVIGAFLGLALSMKSLNIFAMLGLIMLIGLVAKNAILLVDRTNEAKAEGKTLREALMDAGRSRLRPILMTTLSMVFGLLPIALSSSVNSESKNGLGMVLIGGLLSSLVFTLVLVPVIYQRFDKIKDRLTKNRKPKQSIEQLMQE